MENRNQLRALLRKYVSGQSSRSESELVLQWLRSPEGGRELAQLMDELSETAFEKQPGMDPRKSGEIYKRLRASIQGLGELEEFERREKREKPEIPESQESQERPEKLEKPERPETGLRPLSPGRAYHVKKWQAAASLLGFLLLSTAAFYGIRAYNTITYTTGYAQQKVIILPDQSRVTLNGNSTLSFPRNWDDKETREVQLEGEGYFEVKENREKAFTVSTSAIRISVLGTTFNVKSYEEDKTIETTLVEGKVAIRNLGKGAAKAEITLEPNQKATYEKESAGITLDKVRTELYTSWKDGLLVFEDEPVEEIVRELERWYGVSIEIEDKASKKCRFTIKIKNESLDEVLKLFSSTTSVSYSNKNGKILIKGKLCN
ncbi:FecR family protein [Anseongella ginsenosidimutans]|uniref:FecR family protein n=1 Tax=Anseongella ginsenosidimutans TaxID=496056 RepID=A0A4R3KM64_9SPHI|nr:FecR family protein [Anseongella ginsenosidimutans]QEC52497.1 DUF4974 domain-containing protein [Anseongella ginsenosidimutans]TCS85321.1 FecR family protein [Anseongella ginsenosidimutans]